MTTDACLVLTVHESASTVMCVLIAAVGKVMGIGCISAVVTECHPMIVQQPTSTLQLTLLWSSGPLICSRTMQTIILY